MKKFVAIAALASLATVAFAQTPAPALTFSGDMNFGGLATSKGIDGSKSTWRLQSFDPVNSTGGRLNLNANYNAGNYGWYLRVREDDNWLSGNAGTVFLKRAYGWADLVDGKVRASFGRLNTQSWATGSGGGDFEDIGGIDGLVGSTIEFKLVDGLNFGAFIPFQKTADDAGALLNMAQWSAAYKAAGLGDVQGGVAFGNEKLAGATVHKGYFYVGGAYTADKNLIAHVTLFNGYTGDSTNGFNYLAERVEYNFADVLNAPVHGALLASQQIYAKSDLGAALFFKPSMDYTLDIYTLGLSATILSDSAKLPTGSDLKKYGYEIDPFVKANVAKNVSVTAFIGFTSGKNTLNGQESYMGGTAPGFRDTEGTATFEGAASGTGKYTNTDNGSANAENLYAQQAGRAGTQTWKSLTDAVVKIGVSTSIAF